MVVCEGAGSPAEINLRANDIANMGLAQAADLPVIVVGDIDRGGVLAHLFGTLAVLDAADQARIAGFVVNKFRGDPALLEPGLDRLRALTGRPTYGVLPWEERLWLDAEDSLAAVADGVLGRPGPPLGSQWLRVAVVRLPRISNATDAEALACEPGVAVRYVTEPSRLADADLVVLPGSKATVSDLEWLRRTGLADAVVAHAGAGPSGAGDLRGLPDARAGASTIRTGWRAAAPTGSACSTWRSRSTPRSTSATPSGRRGASRCAATRSTTAGWCTPATRRCWTARAPTAGAVLGTHWHGLLENDGFRRALLRRVAEQAGRRGFVPATDTCFAAERIAQLDLLGDLVEKHIDIGSLEHVFNHGAPSDLPMVTTGLAGSAR